MIINISEKKNANSPTIMAPTILVVAKENANKMIEKRMTPKMLVSKTDKVVQMH